MSLPIAWIDRIFERLTLRYGRDFLGRWEGIPIAEVKADWANVLDGFSAQPAAIAWALNQLPDSRAPTAQDFRALCRSAPPPDLPRLPEPKADPERVAAELSKMKKVPCADVFDFKRWARRLKAREESGERLSRFQRDAWRETLRIRGDQS